MLDDFAESVIVGKGYTVIELVCKAELHPKLAPYTLNTALILGCATATPTLFQVVQFGVDADHTYEAAPFEVQVKFCPAQIIGVYEFIPTVGLGTTVNTKLAVDVQTPFDPCRVATPAANEEEKGGVENKEVLGVTGVLLPNKLGVQSVQLLAPDDVSVIVFGEPLKACAHKLLLLKAIAKEGGLVTDTCAMAVMVQELGAVTKTV